MRSWMPPCGTWPRLRGQDRAKRGTSIAPAGIPLLHAAGANVDQFRSGYAAGLLGEDERHFLILRVVAIRALENDRVGLEQMTVTVEHFDRTRDERNFFRCRRNEFQLRPPLRLCGLLGRDPRDGGMLPDVKRSAHGHSPRTILN